MAIYKTTDLLNQLCQIISDGYEFIDVSEFDEDDELPAGLSFEAIENEFAAVGYDGVDATELPDGYDSETSPRKFKFDDFCCDISFTYKEIFTIKHAVDNALEYLKECSKDPSYSKDILSEIKSSTIDIRNLQAKLAKQLKKYSIS